MKRLEITESSNTPHILFDAQENVFKIEGKSFPEDSKEFYRPLLEWLGEFQQTAPKAFTLEFNLFYLSSSSIISVKQILQKVVDLMKAGTQVAVVWKYDSDDDDIRKTGEDYMKLTQLNFSFVENEE